MACYIKYDEKKIIVDVSNESELFFSFFKKLVYS